MTHRRPLVSFSRGALPCPHYRIHLYGARKGDRVIETLYHYTAAT